MCEILDHAVKRHLPGLFHSQFFRTINSIILSHYMKQVIPGVRQISPSPKKQPLRQAQGALFSVTEPAEVPKKGAFIVHPNIPIFFAFWVFMLMATHSFGQDKDYELCIPGTEACQKMVWIAGDTFEMGSKGVSRTVLLSSYWIGEVEITYDLYSHFQFRELDNGEGALEGKYNADAVTRPTPQYMDYTYGMGQKGGFPAVGMTQQAALRFCYWLYQKTGDFYRLPTEAEWEYACLAGQDVFPPKDSAGVHAWNLYNSGEKYHKVKLKKSNPNGLYDMLGNVAEWTLDEFDKEIYPLNKKEKLLNDPMNEPKSRYFRVVKGGAYDDQPASCNCTYRLKGNPSWQARDPQIPKSEWWNPDSPFLGFRLVRPSQEYSSKEVKAFFKTYIKF